MNENERIFLLLRYEFSRTKNDIEEFHLRRLVRLTADLRDFVSAADGAASNFMENAEADAA